MAIQYNSATHGATLTSEEVLEAVIKPLTAQSVVLRAKRDVTQARRAQTGYAERQSPSRDGVVTSRGVPLHIPRITNAEVPDPWRAESTAIAEVTPDLDEITLLPSTLKALKLITRISDEAMTHAVTGETGLMELITDTYINSLGLQLDKALLFGPGTSNTIKGFTQFAGVQNMNSVGPLTIDVLHDATALALTANSRPSAWFAHPRDLIGLRKIKGTDGHPVLQPDPQDASTPLLLGLPVYLTTQIPVNGGTGTDESMICLADMEQVAIARDHDWQAKWLLERYADFGEVGLRITGRYDIAPRNEPAIVVLKGVQPPELS